MKVWANNTVTRFDLPAIEKLCQYFGANLSDLLEYIPADDPPAHKNRNASAQKRLAFYLGIRCDLRQCKRGFFGVWVWCYSLATPHTFGVLLIRKAFEKENPSD